MNIWAELGFRQNPYSTTPVPSTAEGERLLVGRDNELRSLGISISASSLHSTIEGDNGVGKTSLVSVAAYQLQQQYALGETSQALIPLAETFQLVPGITAESFARKVLLSVAHAFISNYDDLKRGGHNVPEIGRIKDWLTEATYMNGGGAGASVLGFGGNVSRVTSLNTSSGFSEAGFARLMRDWLNDCFPALDAGGFVCVIDNLELLETSRAARTLLEEMRDDILDTNGLQWVLCGARGIVRTLGSSPRLEGRLGSPLDLSPVPDVYAAALVDRRIENFRLSKDAVAPVGPKAFTHLYELLHRNLRNALKFSTDFSLVLAQEKGRPNNAAENMQLLRRWIDASASRYLTDTKLGDAAWRVFDHLIVSFGGSCSPSDHPLFGYESPSPMRAQIRKLEEANLVLSSLDETDKRRKTISVTPRGWLVHYARNRAW